MYSKVLYNLYNMLCNNLSVKKKKTCPFDVEQNGNIKHLHKVRTPARGEFQNKRMTKMQQRLRYPASILSRQSLGESLVSKAGNSEQAKVEWVFTMMAVHLLWKLGCLGDPWPDACWLCRGACSHRSSTKWAQQQMHKLSRAYKPKVNKKLLKAF